MFDFKANKYPYICDISIEEYHSLPGLSSSSMKMLLECPYKYWYYYIEKKKNFSTKSMEFGSLVHKYLTEKENFYSKYFVAPTIDKRKKEYKDVLKENEGKQVIFENDIKCLQLIEAQIKKEKYSSIILGKGEKEKSIFWEDSETGVLLKSRPDFFNDEFVIDIKTSACASSKYFLNSIYKYKYNMQAALQLEAFSEISGYYHTKYIYIVIESVEPYVVSTFVLDDAIIKKGINDYRLAIDKYIECQIKDSWHSYVDGIEIIGSE